MHSGFVTVPVPRHCRSMRAKKRHIKSTPFVVSNSDKHKDVDENCSASNDQSTTCTKSWSQIPSSKKCNPVESFMLIQAEQAIENQKEIKLHYESTTNRTFLLSLTLSKIKSDPSLIICASYICRLCQKLNLFVPSTLIIICHQYYQFRLFPRYLRVMYRTVHHHRSMLSCTFINPSNTHNKPLTVNHDTNLTNVLDSCVAQNIHLQYPNLIQIVDKEHKFSSWNNIHCMFQCYHNGCNLIETNIALFDEQNSSNYLDDESMTLNGIYAHDVNETNVYVSLQYDVKYGLFMQINNDIQTECNAFYQLVRNADAFEDTYMWMELNNMYKISSKTLMSVFTENIFCCSRDTVCLYNLEDTTWHKLKSMGSSWKNDAKQLYFDGTEQKMFCMAISDSMVKEYAFNDSINKWMECNSFISFNYYNVVRDNWYHHPSLLLNYDGKIDSVMWIEQNNPHVIYCAVTAVQLDPFDINNRNHYSSHVECYDNRSNYKQWMYHHEKTCMMQNVLSANDGDSAQTFQMDLVL